MLREPLLAFLAIGLLLFGAHRLLGSVAGDDNAHAIVVDRAGLLRFLQHRSKVFGEDVAARSFDAMSAEEKKRLIESFVREEALHREALALGFDKQDYVLRRRMVQSLEFALQSEGAAADPPDEASLRSFFAAHTELYALGPTISFTHVFFRPAPQGWDETEHRARAALAALQAGRSDPRTMGDRFIYRVAYGEQSPEVIARDFGAAFTQTLFEMQADSGWSEPVRSEHGIHLVNIARIDPGGLPTFESVRDRVALDAAVATRRERRDLAIARILSRYRLSVSPELDLRH